MTLFDSATARRVLDATRYTEAVRGGSVVGGQLPFAPDIGWRVAEVRASQVTATGKAYEISWKEVEWDDGGNAWQDKSDGLTSTISADAYARGAVPVTGDTSKPITGGRVLVWPGLDDTTATRWYYVPLWPDEFAALITSVTGSTNATYDAEAISNSNVSVSSATPIDRDLVNGVYTAKAVDDEVTIRRKSDGTFELIADEQIPTSTCVSGGVAASSGAIWINAASSTEISNEAALTDFDIAHTIPANTMVEGNLYRVTAIGELDVDTATDSVAFALRLDNSSIHTVTAKRPGADDRRFALVWLIDIRTTEETFVTCERSQVGSAAGYEIKDNGGTFDETVDNDVEIAIDWTAASANNTATLNTFLIERLL